MDKLHERHKLTKVTQKEMDNLHSNKGIFKNYLYFNDIPERKLQAQMATLVNYTNHKEEIISMLMLSHSLLCYRL